MKTREQIITAMCYTWRHDYGLNKDQQSGPLTSGMTDHERHALWNQMAQIFDNDIAPYMQSKTFNTDKWAQYNWTNWSEP
jgi:hypothetical protein